MRMLYWPSKQLPVEVLVQPVRRLPRAVLLCLVLLFPRFVSVTFPASMASMLSTTISRSLLVSGLATYAFHHDDFSSHRTSVIWDFEYR